RPPVSLRTSSALGSCGKDSKNRRFAKADLRAIHVGTGAPARPAGEKPGSSQFANKIRMRNPTSCARPPGRGRPGLRTIVHNDRLGLRTLHCPYPRVSFRVFGPMPTTGERFERAVSIMARLRGPGG